MSNYNNKHSSLSPCYSGVHYLAVVFSFGVLRVLCKTSLACSIAHPCISFLFATEVLVDKSKMDKTAGAQGLKMAKVSILNILLSPF